MKLLLLGRLNRLSRGGGGGWSGGQGVDNLAGAGVMQLFASLMLDRVGIGLEAVDVTLQQIVLTLKAMKLVVEGCGILPLLLVGGEAVLPEDDVVAQCNGEEGSGSCRDPAPTGLGPGDHPPYGVGPGCGFAIWIRVTHTSPSTDSAWRAVKWKSHLAR